MKQILLLFFVLTSLSLFAQTPGESVDNPLLLADGVPSEFTSYNNGRHVLYAKFTAEDDGTVTITLPVASSFSRWMEEGIMAYGQLRQYYFRNGNQFDVQKDHTYYLYYSFSSETTSTITYTLTPAAEGATRGKALLISADTTVSLLGKPHEGEEFFNTTTWFRLDRQSLAGKGLMTVTLAGDNMGDVSLFKNDDQYATSIYIFGEGAGLIPVNSTITFDLDLANNDYFVAITQNDVNGSATFAFSEVKPGQTLSTALPATLGNNTVPSDAWYRYTHVGDTKKVSFSCASAIYNAKGTVIADAQDATSGIILSDGETVYFQATTLGFTISEHNIPDGEMASRPLIITLDGEGLGQFSFTLSGSESDVRRYMQFTAPADGTFMYGTSNSKVIQVAFGATVRDITNPDSPQTMSIIQKAESAYGMFIYQWQVTEGHTYLIEQTLENNLGRVDFLASFLEAQEGESLNRPIQLPLATPVTLGRTEASATYFKFTAPADGEYLLSAYLFGRVHVYGEEEYNISKDYVNGTDFHNEVIPLTAGESIIFSAAPSFDLDQIVAGVLGYYIPDYYVQVTPIETFGGDIPSSLHVEADQLIPATTSNLWYGPITVPADATLTITAFTPSGTSAPIYFTNEKGQWLASEADISSFLNGIPQAYSLRPSPSERTIYLLSNGTSHTDWAYSFSGAATSIAAPIPSAPSLSHSYTLQGIRLLPTRGTHIVIDKENGKKYLRK